jgi:quinoprotein glucose dehydrogenase
MKHLVIVAIMFAPWAAAGAQTPAADAAGHALVQKNCSSCHALSQVTAAHKSKDDWSATVDKMIGFGAQISDKDYDVIVDHLARTQGLQK